jgi:hypothetical protein
MVEELEAAKLKLVILKFANRRFKFLKIKLTSESVGFTNKFCVNKAYEELFLIRNMI